MVQLYCVVELCVVELCVVLQSGVRVCRGSPSQQVSGVALLVHVHHPQLVSCTQQTISSTATQSQMHKHLNL